MGCASNFMVYCISRFSCVCTCDEPVEPLTSSHRWITKRPARLRRYLPAWWPVMILCVLLFAFAACDNSRQTERSASDRAAAAGEGAAADRGQVMAAQRSTPIPTRTPVPTFTPTAADLRPLIIITPPQQQTPGVIVVPPGMEAQVVLPTPIPPTETPTFPPPTATETPTLTPTFTGTPMPTPTPYIEIQSGLVTLRSGPGVNYPLIAQLGPDIPVALVGRNPQGTWLQICCINGADVWVASQHVLIFNDVSQLPLVNAAPPPTPTETATATATATATPYQYPFELARGPEFTPTNNAFLSIWVKLFVGNWNADEVPAEGYFLEVEFEGFDRPSRYGEEPSRDTFELTASPGAGNRQQYNLKYEYHPYNPDRASYPSATATPTALELIGTGTWTVWVKDGAGNQLSEKVSFTTAPFNSNREVYIAWQRVR